MTREETITAMAEQVRYWRQRELEEDDDRQALQMRAYAHAWELARAMVERMSVPEPVQSAYPGA